MDGAELVKYTDYKDRVVDVRNFSESFDGWSFEYWDPDYERWVSIHTSKNDWRLKDE